MCCPVAAVGILAAMCSFHRGAKRVIIIDNVPFRLEFAQSKVPNLEVLDFGKHDTVKKLREMVPQGPHVTIEAVGFHYTKSLSSKVEMAIGLQTDPSDMLNEMVVATRKVWPTTCNIHLQRCNGNMLPQSRIAFSCKRVPPALPMQTIWLIQCEDAQARTALRWWKVPQVLQAPPDSQICDRRADAYLLLAFMQVRPPEWQRMCSKIIPSKHD